ncbi:hypothetical protein GGI15_002992 [Coemansia interrupta]|uniref:ribonuclease Z n=1 Tax=Coemansia interrupta TaxID=1126814 RepID=A0A9W8HD09_9FUNG|nr:hypothetical protein GGI15_002992 [Coemansia interrupta]
MKWSVQIVRPSTHNVESTSVLVNFPSGRYLFNCSEGTQRLSFENKVRVSKLTAVFLTRVDWSSMGGLPGMLLTLADTGAKNLTISGGHNLTHALAATRHFILRNEMGIRVSEMRDGDVAAVYKDDNLKVTPVHIYPDNYKATDRERGVDESEEAKIRQMLVARAFGTQKPQQTAADKKKNKRRQGEQQQQKKRGYYNESCDGAVIEKRLQELESQQLDRQKERAGYEAPSGMKKRARSPEQGGRPVQAADMALPKTTPTPASICYIAEGPEVPGKFDVQAAKALGLKQGPLYGKLTRGESVTAPDGTVIHPSQCVGPARLSGILIIIDCPTPAYINSLTSNPKFAPFIEASGQSDPKLRERLLLVIHSLGPGVAQDEQYRAWASQFPSHVRHMVSAPEYVPDENPFQRHLRVHAAMTAIDPATYVMPQSSKTPDLPVKSFIGSDNVIVPSSLMTFDFEPKPQLDCSKVQPALGPEEMLEQVQAKMQEEQPSAANGSTDSAVTVTNGTSDELIVCPIGTGSSIPSIYRNVSANIISVNGYGGIVLDCGESTVSLLKRFLGYPKRNIHNTRINLSYTEFVSSLKLLYISHMHADHHLGAILLLHEWNELTKNLPNRPRLTIVAPARFMSWIADFSGVQALGMDRIDFVSCHNIRITHDQDNGPFQPKGSNPVSTSTKVDKVMSDLGLTDIRTCSVIHCPWAYGLSLTHRSGWKLVYSGDTRPCSNLVTLGRLGDKFPTVLLHEATHSDDLIKDAIAKRHTTVSEAVAMALGMGAENLLMTHFSQRCLSLPRWNLEAVRQHSVPRYGNLSQFSSNQASAGASTADTRSDASMATAASECDDDDIPEDDLEDEPAALDDVNDAEAALMRELDEPVSEDEDDGNTSDQSQGTLDCLNIASAFDMSAYGSGDIARYRYNTRRLRKVLREEIRLFIEEEKDASSKDEDEAGDMAVKDKKKQSAKAKH